MVPFTKFHGFGNDYIVIERRSIADGTDLTDLAERICHRHTGAGADGIAVIEKLDGPAADVFCEIINPDGSIAGFSGNGTRCAVSYLYFKSLWDKPELRLETRSGIKNYSLLANDRPGGYIFRAEIGQPRFTAKEIPFEGENGSAEVIDVPILSQDREFLISAVNVGNPVACIFVEDLDMDWRRYGRDLEVHSAFPERANIVFVKVNGPANIELKIWERGVGETASSGTCTSAAAVLSRKKGLTGRKVAVRTEGGVTDIEWREDDEILITGRADLAYEGEWPYA